MAYNIDDLKLSLYELFTDAAQKVKKAENTNERQMYLEQAFQTADKIAQLENSQGPRSAPQL